MDQIHAFEAAVRSSLELAQSGHEVNILDPASLREDLATAHREIEADEIAHGGSSAGKYWDLTMADWSPEEPSVFIITAWRDESLSVYCGSADRQAILDVCHNYSMAEVEEMIGDFAQRIGFAGTTATLPRDVAEAWIKSWAASP